jgi:uncharacterized membrane protein
VVSCPVVLLLLPPPFLVILSAVEGSLTNQLLVLFLFVFVFLTSCLIVDLVEALVPSAFG